MKIKCNKYVCHYLWYDNIQEEVWKHLFIAINVYEINLNDNDTKVVTNTIY